MTSAAEAELRKDVRRTSRARPGLRSVITGCAAGLEAARGPLADLPGVSHVVGGADLPLIAAALELPERAVLEAPSLQSGARALLRIQEGCDEHCTFCATTLARGPSRSRPASALVAEASALAEHHPEIVLTGIHIGSYGADTGTALGLLVERLVREVPRVRFRLSSIEATEVDERLGELLVGAAGRVAPHLHAPLQSGSDIVLRRMGRHWYRAEDYAAAVERLAGAFSPFALGADVIAGFPGESEADHEASMALVRRLPFTYLHVFPYSPRPGTAALRLDRHLAAATVARRARELRELGAAKAASHRAARDGGDADVVVVGSAGRREGLTEDYLSVGLADPAVPRGRRLHARLELRGERLVASELTREDR